MINATAGMLGFFDVATAIGIDERNEDFGQTLAYWGVPSGHYIVLPFWGSSTIRDVHGLVIDGFINPVNSIEDIPDYVAVKSLDVVDSRADVLAVEKLITGDRYSFLKNAYLQDRHYLENDGNVEDTFDTGETEDENWME
jgi:phospholipid-binding lipoprotein MlaA